MTITQIRPFSKELASHVTLPPFPKLSSSLPPCPKLGSNLPRDAAREDSHPSPNRRLRQVDWSDVAVPASAHISHGPREDSELVLDSAGKPIGVDLDR